MKSISIFSFLLVAFALSIAPAYAQSPVSLDDYRRVVAETLASTQQANLLPAADRAPLLNNTADALGKVHEIQLPSGAQVSVDNSALVALIRDASKTDNAVERLTALRDALAQTPATINPADLAALQNILNHPPFVQDASSTPTWLQDLLRRIAEFLDRLLGNTVQGVFDARDLIVLGGILLVVVVLIYFLRNLRRNLVQEEAVALMAEEHAVRTPGDAFNNAQQFMNLGDYRNAVRQLYLATLLLLDQRGKLKYDPTLTNREYLVQAANDPRASAALKPIVETFDRTWYGFQAISRQEFDAYRARVEAVKEL